MIYLYICKYIHNIFSVSLIIEFRFPKDVSLRKAWATYCNIQEENIKSKDCLCLKHFSIDSYKVCESRTVLKPGATPTEPIIQ